MRVIIPWEEIDDQTKRDMGYVRCDAYPEGKLATYEMIERRCTRPITPDDIRSCLRMPDEWTGKENQSFMAVVNDNLRGAEAVAIKFLDIATRPAPEPDPWEEMDKLLKENAERQRANYPFTLDMANILVTWNRLKAACKEDE